MIDGQGNWGSQDDPKSFAAMRYTESKLTSFANLLISTQSLNCRLAPILMDLIRTRNISIKTSSHSFEWNIRNCSRYGYRYTVHNINEAIDATVKILEKPKSELKDLLKIIKGPDFSNAAPIIVNSEELRRCIQLEEVVSKFKQNGSKKRTQLL